MQRLDEYRLRLPREGSMRQPATIYASASIQIEGDAVRQLRNAASLDDDAVVLATPDIHTGYGVPIGCVFASPHLISPSAVGYDINCGMRLMATPFAPREIDAGQLAHEIRRVIPLGEGKHNVKTPRAALDAVLQRGLGAVPDVVVHDPHLANAFDAAESADDCRRTECRGSLAGQPPAVGARAHERGCAQLGTLGGGNHFIEIQLTETVYDKTTAATFGLEAGRVAMMIHSGSRGLGHQVAGDYMHAASQWCERQRIALPDRELAYFTLDSDEGKEYLGAMNAAANFAYANRYLMALFVRSAIRRLYGADVPLPCVYDVAHNIAVLEEHRGRTYCVHRKGATRAYPAALMSGTPFSVSGQPVLIPGSMGTASYVLAGTPSGAESLYSVNHGAGRVMSRTAASGRTRRGKQVRQAAISDQEFARSMEGVTLICEDRRTIKEEAPGAYKDIDEVVSVVTGAGLAKLVARMRPLAVLKG
jgi:tRNA-splicing ligase RtcB